MQDTTTRPDAPKDAETPPVVHTVDEVAVALRLANSDGQPNRRAVYDLVRSGALRPVDPTQPTQRWTISAAELGRYIGRGEDAADAEMTELAAWLAAKFDELEKNLADRIDVRTAEVIESVVELIGGAYSPHPLRDFEVEREDILYATEAHWGGPA